MMPDVRKFSRCAALLTSSAQAMGSPAGMLQNSCIKGLELGPKRLRCVPRRRKFGGISHLAALAGILQQPNHCACELIRATAANNKPCLTVLDHLSVPAGVCPDNRLACPHALMDHIAERFRPTGWCNAEQGATPCRAHRGATHLSQGNNPRGNSWRIARVRAKQNEWRSGIRKAAVRLKEYIYTFD